MAALLFIFDLALVWFEKIDLGGKDGLVPFIAIMIVSIVLTVFKNEKLTNLISGTWGKLIGSFFKAK